METCCHFNFTENYELLHVWKKRKDWNNNNLHDDNEHSNIIRNN